MIRCGKILKVRAIKVAKHDHVYTCGDCAETIYFVESGQVKLLMLSPEGKGCLLAIHTAGDILGELRLSGISARMNIERRFIPDWPIITKLN